jgi:hypothetical protein
LLDSISAIRRTYYLLIIILKRCSFQFYCHRKFKMDRAWMDHMLRPSPHFMSTVSKFINAIVKHTHNKKIKANSFSMP